jgi:hypothetical protein
MTTTAFVQFLTINGSSYQNYWVGQAVNGAGFYPFVCDGFLAAATSAQDSVQVTLPLTAETVAWLEDGLANAWLVAIKLYQFDPTLPGVPPPLTLVTEYHGEVLSGRRNASQLSIEVGSSLSPVIAQVPPRKYTTTLVGEPPRY